MKDFHYFVSHGMGWATGETLDEAMKKAFCTSAFGDMRAWLRNVHKEGQCGIPAFTCRVPVASDANYSIEWFVPKVDGLTDRQNVIVTYVTGKMVNWLRDPEDEIRELKKKLENYNKILSNSSE